MSIHEMTPDILLDRSGRRQSTHQSTGGKPGPLLVINALAYGRGAEVLAALLPRCGFTIQLFHCSSGTGL